MTYLAECDGKTSRVEIDNQAETMTVRIEGLHDAVEGRRIAENTYSLLVGGRSYVADVSQDGAHFAVSIRGRSYRIRVTDERQQRASSSRSPTDLGGRHEIRAMMPGKVVDVLVAVGSGVELNQGLVIVEAMKMENEIRSPAAGQILEIHVRPGQTVKVGDPLLVIE